MCQCYYLDTNCPSGLINNKDKLINSIDNETPLSKVEYLINRSLLYFLNTKNEIAIKTKDRVKLRNKEE